MSITPTNWTAPFQFQKRARPPERPDGSRVMTFSKCNLRLYVRYISLSLLHFCQENCTAPFVDIEVQKRLDCRGSASQFQQIRIRNVHYRSALIIQHESAFIELLPLKNSDISFSCRSDVGKCAILSAPSCVFLSA